MWTSVVCGMCNRTKVPRRVGRNVYRLCTVCDVGLVVKRVR